MRRAETLERHLREMIPDARRFGISIYISDDSPDDLETEGSVRALAKLYPSIRYRRNVPTAGHDNNLMQTLAWAGQDSGADFVWLLSDSLRILPGMLERIVERALGGEDFIFLNAICNSQTAREVRPERPRESLPSIVFNLTLTGATLYHRRVLDWVASAEPVIYRNFPQISIILAYASAHPGMRMQWVPYYTMETAPKQSYWLKHVFRNWVDDWSAVVMAFPDVINPELQPTIRRSHSRNTGMFGVRNLLSLRADGQFTSHSLRHPGFLETTHLPAPLVASLLLIPPAPLRLLKRGKELFVRPRWSPRVAQVSGG
jgi:hypothetical protein